MDKSFPEKFLWGAATASYQVEGGIENNDWAQAARHSRVPESGQAADHYNRFEGDFDLAKSLGQNAHRFSIEWSRIEPEEGKFNQEGITHYDNVLDALRSRGLQPMVTLWHFTLPQWLADQGGFDNPKAIEYFTRYCAHVVKHLGNKSRFWITINEPMVYASQGYMKGIWPPFQKDVLKYFRICRVLAKAHNSAYQEMKKIDSSLQVGIAKNNIFFNPAWWPGLSKWFWNHRFLCRISKNLDFIGLNFYFSKFIFGFHSRSDMGWKIYPKGIYHVLKELKSYRLPIYITENGLADAEDKYRAKFIRSHLFWTHQAMTQGVDVRGYFYWSLLDNFEWAHGFQPRFGLAAVNYDNMERTIRPSALVYKKICEKNHL